MLSVTALYDLLVGAITGKEGLRYTLQVGAPSVMITGIIWMQELCADNWDLVIMVLP